MHTVDLAELTVGPGGRLLDIGCGSGRHLASVCAWPGVHVVGADRQVQDLHAAWERVDTHQRLGCTSGSPWSLLAADITALPFADQSFQRVICSEVLEHVLDDGQAVSELVRVLAPGGILAVSVPRAWPEVLCWGLCEDYRRQPGGHVRIYHRHRLTSRLAQSGLRIFRCHYAHGLHSPFWWLKCCVGLHREKGLVGLYHRFLTWQLFHPAHWSCRMEQLLNPVMGKSVVVYARKPA